MCSIIGAFYEEIMHIIFYYIHHHTFNFSPRRGVFWGPISTVYGFGGIFLAFLLVRKKKGLLKSFFLAFLGGGLIEYILSYLQELITGTTSWDYSNKFLNINGRTTVIYMLFWGILGIIFVKLIYPLINKILKKLQKSFYKSLTIMLIILVFWDILISWTALARKELRQKNIEPFTVIGIFYDKHFNDEYINRKFPNMKEK